MLHELLLSLSGHPSPLLSSKPGNAKDDFGPFQPLLSPAEHALLKTLSEELGVKHKSIRGNATQISSSHPSIVCRAVSAAIISTHLADFQKRILEVERNVIEENPHIVGAYNIVPLSAVVGAFDGWGRRLSWLWDLVRFIQEPGTEEDAIPPGHDARSLCTAAGLIQWLRSASHTGYPDIERMALDLIKVAEMAWLKQVSAWVLYGRHPGATDFLVTRDGEEAVTYGPSSSYSYRITASLVPCFVTSTAANSILFIGKSLNRIKDRKSSTIEQSYGMATPELSLLPNHLAQLSALQSPINSATFSAAISAIRLSLSHNALQKLLPMSKVLETLQVLKDFFLLERGEFAVALITAADERLSSHHQHSGTGSKAALRNIDDLSSLTIRDGEVHSVLTRTWTTLASLQIAEDDEHDESLDRARELVTLSIKTLDSAPKCPKSSLGERTTSPASFDDLLLPSSTVLSLRVPSPLDLFLTSSDTETYSDIHAYLLAIRRAHLRLSKLFLLSILRRDHPSLRAAQGSGNTVFDVRAAKRHRAARRSRTMRPIWATIGSAVFFFAELGEYLQGQVVQSSWSSFYDWLAPSLAPAAPSNVPTPLSSSSRPGGSQISSKLSSSRRSDEAPTYGMHDPESMSQAHRSYLDALRHSLLLDEGDYTTLLRRQMTAIDHISALMQRLNTLQQSLEVDTDASEDMAPSPLAEEELSLVAELHSSHLEVSGGIQRLVASLRNIDNARGGGRDLGNLKTPGRSENEFVPWSGGGLDRLLLKFDYGECG